LLLLPERFFGSGFWAPMLELAIGALDHSSTSRFTEGERCIFEPTVCGSTSSLTLRLTAAVRAMVENETTVSN
jgi:hypothetical protein